MKADLRVKAVHSWLGFVSFKIMDGWMQAILRSECFYPRNSYVEISPPKVMVLEGGGFWKWLDHEGKILMNEISDFVKEASVKRCLYRRQTLVTDAESAGALIFDFPASRTVRNECLWCKSPSLCHCCYKRPEWTKTLGWQWNFTGASSLISGGYVLARALLLSQLLAVSNQHLNSCHTWAPVQSNIDDL